ncbi:nucleotidyltransferase family protein [Iodidimonas muriae]|nr:nucleotidyltransferase family protein [Iodidimonas muriae]
MSALAHPESHRSRPDGQNIACVILAAGLSRRMGGGSKMLAPLQGVPMIVHSVRAAQKARIGPILVVVGHQAAAVRQCLAGEMVRIVENPDYECGLSASVKAGVQAVPDHCAAALFMLGDMPRVAPETLHSLVQSYWAAEKPPAVVPYYHGKRGNPVLWDRSQFFALAALQGDQGARGLLKALGSEIQTLDVKDQGILQDADDPASLARIHAAFERD